MKALMRGLRTRLECRYTSFVRTENALWKFTFGEKFDGCPVDSNSLPLGDFPIELSPQVMLHW